MSSMALLYFLTYFIFPFFLVAGQTPKYVLKGEGDHLKPNIPGQPNSILWKHNGNKIVEFDGSEEQVYDPYKHRITLNWITAELEITDLRYEDSGDYELEVDIHNKVYTSESKLEVIDKVAMPTISCELNKGSSTDGSEVKATLLCSAKPRKPESLMKFEWSSQGKLHPGNKLPISLGDTEIDEEYVCIVRNPLSTDKATFRAKDCYHEKNSSIALGVGLFFLFLLLGAVVGTVVFLKWKQKACFAKGQQGDVEKQSPAKGSGQKAERTEEGRPLIGGVDRAETFASHQPLRRFQQNHETSSDEWTAAQKAAGVDNQAAGAVVSPGHVDDMRKIFEKNQGFKNNPGGQVPASPLPFPGIKDQGLSEIVDKDDHKENEPEHSDQLHIEERNGLKRTETPEEKYQDQHSDVESTANQQVGSHHDASDSEGEEDGSQDSISTEAVVKPTDHTEPQTENYQNLSGNKDPKDTVLVPKSSPEQGETSGTKEGNEPNQSDRPEKTPEDKPPGVESTANQQGGSHYDASGSEGEEDDSQDSDSTEAGVKPTDHTEPQTENYQNLSGYKDPKDTVLGAKSSPEQGETSGTKEGNEPNQTDTPEKTPEDKPPGVESSANQQESTRRQASTAGGDGGEGQASNSTEARVEPSDDTQSQTKNPQNLSGYKKPEDALLSPELNPERGVTSGTVKQENGRNQTEKKSEDKPPGVESSDEQQDGTRHQASNSEGDKAEGQDSNSIKAEVKPADDTEPQTGDPQNPASDKKPEDSKSTSEQPVADQTTAQRDRNSPPPHSEPIPPSAPLPDSTEQNGKTSPRDGDTNSEESKDAETEPENNQRECEEAPSVPDTKNELQDSQPKSPLTEDSAGLDPKESDGEQQTESTAETAATTANKSNQGDQESKNEPDESDGENSSKVPDSEDSDQQQEKSSNEPENNSNIKETNSQKSVAPGTPAQPEDVSDGGETEKKLDSATSQQPKNTTPTGDPSTTGEDNQPLHQKT